MVGIHVGPHFRARCHIDQVQRALNCFEHISNYSNCCHDASSQMFSHRMDLEVQGGKKLEIQSGNKKRTKEGRQTERIDDKCANGVGSCTSQNENMENGG